ncbi:substrate-binding periplasmic protein [Alteromonas sp. CYL-A6]|uniref:substrate-binding periplasmic protein n=1 Tax=Alteromonas nitratireducens TaxID=3390813 RepID=UPI0034A87018
MAVKRALSLLLLLLLACSAPFMAGAATKVRFYGEVSAPFYWVDEQGREQGASIDLVNALIADAGLDATIEHLPWARAYYEATQHPNVILMSVLRTPLRETEFQWLGKIQDVRASLISLSSRHDLIIQHLDDARRYRVGTIRGYGSARYLLEQGFTENNNLVLAHSTEQLWTLLFTGRIDMVLANLMTERYEIQSIGFDPNQVREVYNVVPLNLTLDMATGHLTTPQMVKHITDSLAAIKASGRFDAIMQKWGLSSARSDPTKK